MERRENPDPRFIPAGAGNTHARHQRRRPGAVYPRWRGEHSHSTWRIRFLPGLSPLARGTRRRRIELKRYLRFIPAGAGNTSLPRWDMNPEAVYPRWRGEHERVAILIELHAGLSPLARGTPAFTSSMTFVGRFIPAGAGNTDVVNPLPSLFSVYPRWRGEHADPQLVQRGLCGLSPLARGTPFAGAETSTTRRFIPAGAGNTISSSVIVVSRSVYPRWRGEHDNGRPHTLEFFGLSPLARGTP